MRKFLIFSALMIVMASRGHAVVTDFEDRSLPVLNEELRKLTTDSRLVRDDLQGQIDAINSVPPGALFLWAASSIPTGYLECDGSAVSRTTYSGLFSVIGTTWGSGDGSTTFNVPDLRGRAPIGAGTGSGLSARTLAATGGEELHTMTTSELVAHTHTVNAVTTTGTGTSGLAFQIHDATSAVTSSSTGSTTPFNVMQPFIVTKFIIKT